MAEPRVQIVHGAQPIGAGPVWPGAERLSWGTEWYAWRLLGGNNREVGRSAVVYDTAAQARDSVLSGRDQVAVSDGLLNAQFGLWTWTLHSDGAPFARGGRGYQRMRECRASLEMFVRALRHAEFATSCAVLGRSVGSAARRRSLVDRAALARSLAEGVS